MKMLGTLLILLLVVALAGAGIYLANEENGNGGGRGFGRGGPISVEIQTAALDDFDDRIEAVGSARAVESVTITARVSDTVQRVAFEDGDEVDEGDVLIELTNAEELADLAEAEAILKEARQQLQRTSELIRRGNSTQVALDQARREVKAAESRLAASQARVNDRVIRAPFAGLLGLRQVSQGTLISPGAEITTLDDVTPILVDFSVPERFLSAIGPGQTVLVSAPAYPDRTFRGLVRTVSSRIDPISRAAIVRAALPNEQAELKPGMLMSVTLVSNERRSLAVLESALVPVNQDQYVFVVSEDGRAERRLVSLGARRPGIVEVRDGLARGEAVVVTGTLRLRDGVPVRITRRDGQPVVDTDRPGTNRRLAPGQERAS